MNWTDKSGTLLIDGKNLEWASFGPKPSDEPIIVMLHEGLGCVAMWKDTPKQLFRATGLSVFAYSRAGYGASSPVSLPRRLDYMTHEATNVLPLVLDALGASRVILLGHSDGATIAAEYAGRVFDRRIRGLVLIAPHFFVEEKALSAIAKAKTAYETSDLRDRLAKYHNHPDTAFYGWNDAWLDYGFRDWDISDVIEYFRVPCLVIQGENDAYGSLAQVRAVEDQSYAPVETCILSKIGHSPHIEAPSRVMAAISDYFLRLTHIEDAVVNLK